MSTTAWLVAFGIVVALVLGTLVQKATTEAFAGLNATMATVATKIVR